MTSIYIIFCIPHEASVIDTQPVILVIDELYYQLAICRCIGKMSRFVPEHM